MARLLLAGMAVLPPPPGRIGGKSMGLDPDDEASVGRSSGVSADFGGTMRAEDSAGLL